MGVNTMEITNEKIIEALEVIIGTCKKHYQGGLNCCSTCPLRNNYGDCGIVESEEIPRTWNINKIDEWKAF